MLRLGRHEVHVWRAQLDLHPLYVQRFINLLSDQELTRAGRFHFQRDRRRFIVARGLLRMLLSRYLRQAPSQLVFCYNRYGKPGLIASHHQDMLEFNVSHSCGLALYAVTRGRKIGIDLERISGEIDCEQVAEHLFSAGENASLQSLSDQEVHRRAFFNCWTRKEAYIKARGEGLSLPLNQFDVSLVPGEPAMLLKGGAETSRWALRELEPAPGYVAALAVEGHDWQLACWEWPENEIGFLPATRYAVR